MSLMPALGLNARAACALLWIVHEDPVWHLLLSPPPAEPPLTGLVCTWKGGGWGTELGLFPPAARENSGSCHTSLWGLALHQSPQPQPHRSPFCAQNGKMLPLQGSVKDSGKTETQSEPGGTQDGNWKRELGRRHLC